MNSPSLLLLSCLAFSTAQVSAFTYTVINSAGSGAGSLRSGIDLANASADASRVITFDPALKGSTISLQSYLVILKPMTIEGPPFVLSNIFGQSDAVTLKSAVGTSNNLVIMDNAAVGQSHFKWLWLEGGGGSAAFPDGGAIHLIGSGVKLNLDQCYLNGNEATRGGAIYCESGEVEAIDCIFTGNIGIGGAVQANHDASFTGRRCQFGSNTSSENGGAIVLLGGAVGDFRNCLFGGNYAYGGGGAISAGGISTVSLLNCTCYSNDSGGSPYEGTALRSAVNAFGSFTITNCLIAGNGNLFNIHGECFGPFISGGHNIVGRTDGSTGLGPLPFVLGNLPRDTDLVATIDEPFPGSTHIYKSVGSPIISYFSIAHDAGDSTASAPLLTDIDGKARIKGAAVDIGCYEAYPELVTNHDDSGNGSLRQTLLDQAQWIEFDPAHFSTPRTISLLTKLPDITALTFIDGSTAARVNIGSDVMTPAAALCTLAPFGIEDIVTLHDLNFGPSTGRGIDIDATGQGMSKIDRCTIRECVSASSANAGGLTVASHLTLINSTISGNTAGGIGVKTDGGNNPQFRAINCTITGNTAVTKCPAVNITGGNSALFTFGNCIISGNTATSPVFADEVIHTSSLWLQTLTNLGHNLLSQASTVSNNDLISTDPRLAPLAHNGHHTFTHAPLLDSPAIDSGTATFSDDSPAPVSDQLSLTRTTLPDIGANEWTAIDYTAWKPLVFTATPAPLQGPGGDPDGDGIINILEFYMGTDPTLPNPAPWSGTMENSNLIFRYPLARGRIVSSSLIQVSTDLVSWAPASATPVLEVAAGVQDLMKVTLPADLPKNFTRLSITP